MHDLNGARPAIMRKIFKIVLAVASLALFLETCLALLWCYYMVIPWLRDERLEGSPKLPVSSTAVFTTTIDHKYTAPFVAALSGYTGSTIGREIIKNATPGGRIGKVEIIFTEGLLLGFDEHNGFNAYHGQSGCETFSNNHSLYIIVKHSGYLLDERCISEIMSSLEGSR